ncbi:primosomal replication protein PriC [Thalassotalea sp. G2M2-11]|uniref:primosomal replication protein PriC n=1 Tax=Thalassotalea sp. G2M2-11 TaxID=2787627 RepID=UPI0019D2AE5E|nr:primosomal replication protein PriC [Thalassotalea sp. G2M2-11]
MITQHTIARLHQVLENLHSQANEIDQQNKQNKAFSFRKDTPLFSEALFHSHSEYFVPYVNEVKNKVAELALLLEQHQHQFSIERLQKVEQQISAIINAIKSNQTLNKTSAKQFAINQQRKYKLAAQSVIASSQALHQKLAETFEFERRLQVMLDEKQKQLLTTKHQQTITNEILVLHQRLGRCRQAISKLERQIEMSEKR